MNRIAFVLSFALASSLALVSAGCAVENEEVADSTSAAASANPSWHKVFDCRDGVVDVDLSERRDFQLVVRNAERFGEFDRFPFRPIKNDHERIYRGSAVDGRGVFDSRAFTGFFANDVVGSPAGLPGYVVRADLGAEIVRFVAVDLRSCSGHLRNNELDKECTVVGEVTLRECRLLDIPD